MFGYLMFIVAVVGGVVAAYFDLLTTEIPDEIPLAMAILGLSGRFVYSLILGDFWILGYAFIVGGLFFIFGFGMYYAGQWGGGDAKLLAVVGILLPVLPAEFSPVLIFPFPLAFLMNLFILGAGYIILYAFVLSFFNPKISHHFLLDIKGNLKNIGIFSSVITIFTAFLFYFLPLRFGVNINISTPVSLIAGFISLFLLWRYLKIVEEIGFKKRIKTKDLKVGDMLGEDVPELGLKSKIIRGLTEEEIEKIKLLKKTIWIKEGVRFGPVFPLALVITLFFGDILAFI